VFDPRVILAWALATPAALFVAHRLLPVVWPRVLPPRACRRPRSSPAPTTSGRKLAARLRHRPASRHPLRRLLRRPRPRQAAERDPAREPGAALRARRSTRAPIRST
jgi:hypothetical protein